MGESERGLGLEYAGLLYWDRTLALRTGEVVPDGIDLRYRVFEDPGELFVRQCRDAEFDLSELSFSSYLAMISRGDDRFVGIPIFPSRHFRHAQLYVNADAGISRPEDLRGRTVGVLEYQMTAALWIRAFLQHDYDVPPSAVDWVTGGLRTPEYVERLELELPADVSLRRIGADETLEGLLESGGIAALISAYPPERMGQPGSRVQHMFPDFRSVERDYYQRTKIFPIMHLVAIRREHYEKYPWIARSLYAAFEHAQEMGSRRIHQITGLAVSLPWLESELAEVERLFDGNPFRGGVRANRATIEALLDYSAEQGLSSRRLAVEEIFAPETLDT
jgi:4,5-dihydroxyphthalate decarboxylase